MDAVEGLVKSKPVFFEFTPFTRVKACYAILNPEVEDDAAVIKAIEGAKAFRVFTGVGHVNSISEVDLKYLPPGEKLLTKEEKDERMKPKIRVPYQPLFKDNGLWRCAVCNWQSAKPDRAILYNHLMTAHGIDKISGKNGDKLTCTTGLYEGLSVHCYLSKEALDKVIRGVKEKDDGTPDIKAGDKVQFIYGTAKGDKEIVGDLVAKKALIVSVTLADGSVKNFRKANIKGEITPVK